MKKRKALSEIISVMIILFIVSVAGVLLYNFSLQITLAQQSSLQDEVDRETGAAMERFKIIGIQRVENNIMQITVLNFAKDNTVDIVVSEIYVNGIRVESKYGEFNISVGKISTITAESPVTLLSYSEPSNPSYNVLVVSERGVGTSYVWNIPD